MGRGRGHSLGFCWAMLRCRCTPSSITSHVSFNFQNPFMSFVDSNAPYGRLPDVCCCHPGSWSRPDPRRGRHHQHQGPCYHHLGGTWLCETVVAAFLATRSSTFNGDPQRPSPGPEAPGHANDSWLRLVGMVPESVGGCSSSTPATLRQTRLFFGRSDNRRSSVSLYKP